MAREEVCGGDDSRNLLYIGVGNTQDHAILAYHHEDEEAEMTTDQVNDVFTTFLKAAHAKMRQGARERFRFGDCILSCVRDRRSPLLAVVISASSRYPKVLAFEMLDKILFKASEECGKNASALKKPFSLMKDKHSISPTLSALMLEYELMDLDDESSEDELRKWDEAPKDEVMRDFISTASFAMTDRRSDDRRESPEDSRGRSRRHDSPSPFEDDATPGASFDEGVSFDERATERTSCGTMTMTMGSLTSQSLFSNRPATDDRPPSHSTCYTSGSPPLKTRDRTWDRSAKSHDKKLLRSSRHDALSIGLPSAEGSNQASGGRGGSKHSSGKTTAEGSNQPSSGRGDSKHSSAKASGRGDSGRPDGPAAGKDAPKGAGDSKRRASPAKVTSRSKRSSEASTATSPASGSVARRIGIAVSSLLALVCFVAGAVFLHLGNSGQEVVA